jgi:ATP-binding cassette subfamily F protein uup
LDLAGIQWLEGVLQTAAFASVVVSHDRYLLENFATEVVELNRVYEDGLLRVKGNYSDFLQVKEDYLHAQGKRQEALANRVHTEVEWLRRGPKARTSKSKARIDTAQDMIGQLAELNARTRVYTADIDFTATDRRTKQLIELEDVAYAIGDRTLFRGIRLAIKPGMRVGLVDPTAAARRHCCGLCVANSNRQMADPKEGPTADCLFRSEPAARSGYYAQTRAGAGQ